MRRVNPFLAVGIVLYAIAGPAQALGFGKVSNATVLGQPLNLSTAVRLDPDETLAADCVSAEVQSGENRIAKEMIRLSIEPGTEANERSIRITTSSLIDEPVVTINLSAGCKARLARRFVVFVDPPEIALAQSQTVDPGSLPVQKVESPAAPALALAQQPRTPRAAAPAASSPAPRVAPRTRSRNRIVLPDTAPKAVATPASAAPTPSQRSTTVAVRQPPKASEPQSRLKLEAPLPGVGGAASAAAMAPNAAERASAAAAAAQARAEEATAALARERQRLQQLEESLSKLLRESQTTQASLATLQARLRESESQQGMPTQTIYGLGGLVGLLAVALALLGWQLVKARRQQKWWDESVAAGATTRGAGDTDSRRPPEPMPPAAAPSARKSTTPASASPAAPAAPATAPAKAPAARSEKPSVATVAAFEDSGGAQVGDAEPVTPPMSRTGPRRELSVEELIDLEQQAEFFIVLGQDDAAIDLLMNHVRSTGGISPLPYMKLLEIYRRLGDEAAYERIRERFNRRFNAYAPEWGADLQMGRTIEGYPQIITRLQTLWPNPVRVMETLDASLFRRDNEDETFELPAYRDLLFLYSIARDLAERDVGGGESDAVDLLLPFDGGEDASVSVPTSFSPAGPGNDPLSLDLDVSLPGAIEFTPPTLPPKG